MAQANDGKVDKNSVLIELGAFKCLAEDKGIDLSATFEISATSVSKLTKMRRMYVAFREPERDGFLDEKALYQFSGKLLDVTVKKAPAQFGTLKMHFDENTVVIKGLRQIRACEPASVILFPTQQEIEFEEEQEETEEDGQGDLPV